MKTTHKLFFLLLSVVFTSYSCNETLVYTEPQVIIPKIEFISPTEGVAGTLITIKGEGLQYITKAYIGDSTVNVKYRISSKEIVIEASATGRSGFIKIKADNDSVISTQQYTYTYVTPQIISVPETLTVGNTTVIKGLNLNSVSEVYIDSKKAEIIAIRNNEVAFKVPFVSTNQAVISVRYFDGSKNQKLDALVSSAMDVKLPIINPISSPILSVGDEIIITGKNLQYVDSIKIGNTNMVMTSRNETTIVLSLIDNPLEFKDGVNYLKMQMYGYGTEYIKEIENLEYFVPSFYSWNNQTIYGRNKAYGFNNTFFCLETGISYHPNNFDSLDPLLTSKQNTITGNKINTNLINETEYLSVKPYFYLCDVASSISLFSPAYTTNFKYYYKGVTINSTTGEGSGGTSITGGNSYCGTPVLFFRILDPNVTTEAALINQVKSKSFSELNFTTLLANSGIDFGSTVSDAGYSNAFTGFAPALKSSNSASTIRTFGPASLSFTSGAGYSVSADNEVDAIIVVLYMKYGFTSTVINASNVYKAGFVRVKHYNQIPLATSGYAKPNISFNAYWQRTPNL